MEPTLTRITTFDEATAHLASTCAVDKRTDAQADVTVTLTPRTSWKLELRRILVLGAPWIEITGVIGQARSASPQGMLVNNADLTIGGLAVSRDGSVVLRQSLPLDGLRLVDLDETIHAVAEQAAKAASSLQPK